MLTSDGAVLMSTNDDGMNLDWLSYALLAGTYAGRPVEACDPNLSQAHLLGPDVCFNINDRSILWRWSPKRVSDIPSMTNIDKHRVMTSMGNNTSFKLQDVEIDNYEAAALFIEQLCSPGSKFRFQRDPDDTIYTVHRYDEETLASFGAVVEDVEILKLSGVSTRSNWNPATSTVFTI